MSTPSEPEKYSIDEMMERLKDPPAEGPVEGGELVTRADGSQAIRVRKRKRRSQQPQKKAYHRSQRIRMIQVAAAVTLVLLAVVGAGVAILLANSAPFREKLLAKIARSCGASVEVEQFRMNPTSANAAQLAFTWPQGNILQRLTLGNVRADVSLSSFFGQSLAGEEVTSAVGTLLLRAPVAQQSLWANSGIAETLPVRFKRYAVTRANVLLGDGAAPRIRLDNSEVSFYPTAANGHSQLHFYCGDITFNGWPKMRMDRAHIEFRGTELDVIGMRLQHESDNRGLFELTGTVTPFSTDHDSRLAVRLESYLLAGLTGPELGRFFLGRIDSRTDANSNCLTFTPSLDSDASLAVAFSHSSVAAFEIKGFPFLFGLAQTLEDDWFESPVFESDVSGTLRRCGGNVSLGDLSFESKDRMALRGAVTLAPDRQLSGKFQVGVAEAVIQSARSRRLDSMFSAPSEGFRWITLKIGGTAAVPTDNFKALFEAISPVRTPDPADADPTLEDPTKPK